MVMKIYLNENTNRILGVIREFKWLLTITTPIEVKKEAIGSFIMDGLAKREYIEIEHISELHISMGEWINLAINSGTKEESKIIKNSIENIMDKKVAAITYGFKNKEIVIRLE
jgi:hypothetical protein